jgi:hypothetical protein
MTIVEEEMRTSRNSYRSSKTIVNYLFIDKQMSTTVGLKDDEAIKHFRRRPALCGHDKL